MQLLADPVNALVTTHSGLFEIELSTSGALTKCERIDDGYHYGIWVKDADSFLVYRGGENVHAQTEREIRRYKRVAGSWSVADVTPIDASIDAIHQIALIDRSRLVITNTLYNEVVLVDVVSHEVLERYRFDDTNNDLSLIHI